MSWITLPARNGGAPIYGRKGLEHRVLAHLDIHEDPSSGRLSLVRLLAVVAFRRRELRPTLHSRAHSGSPARAVPVVQPAASETTRVEGLKDNVGTAMDLRPTQEARAEFGN